MTRPTPGRRWVAGETAIGFDQATLVDTSSSDVGSDDEGATGPTTSLALSSLYAGGAIGIQTTAGEDIDLALEGGVIVGRVMGGANDNQAVFAISISGGQVTVEQYESLDHTPSTDDDDSLTLGSNLIDAVVSITDGDNDTDTAAIDIGGQIKFEDDGPTAAISLTGNMAVTDETVGLPDPDGDNDQVGNDETNAGAPLVAGETAIGFDQATLVDTSSSDVGSDDEGATGPTTSLALSSLYAGGAIGIQTTAGEDIDLALEGGVIVGRVMGGANDNQAVFAISISGGQVTVEQYMALDHTPSVDADDSLTLGSNLIDAVVSITDGDNDTDTAAIDIGGQIKFEDDGPSVTGASDIKVDEEDATWGFNGNAGGDGTDLVDGSVVATGSLAGFGYGSDGAGTIVLDSSAGSWNGTKLVSNDGNWEITINQTTGAYAINLLTPTDHTNGDNIETDLNFTVNVTVTDGDGDTATTSFDVLIDDDVPEQNNATATATVHEDALNTVLSKGNNEPGKVTTALITAATLAALVDFGADGAAVPAFALNDSLSGDTGLTSQGDTVYFFVTAAGVVQGVTTGGGAPTVPGDVDRVVFTLEESGSDFLFTLLDQVDNDADDDLTTGEGEGHLESVDVSGAFIATDGDGDSIVLDAGSVAVQIENDAPVPFFPEHAFVVNNGVAGNGDIDGPFQINFAQVVGADEVGDVVFDSALNGATLTDVNGESVTAGGESITLALSGGGTVLTGSTASGNVFVITITGDTYTVDLGEIPFDDGTVLSSINIFDEAENPGKFLFNQIDDLEINGTELDILVSGSDQADTGLEATNISQQGTGIGSQGVGEDQTIRFDFGMEFVRSNTGSNTGSFTTTGAEMVTTAAVGISQTNPNGQEAVALIEAMNTAFSFPGDNEFDHNDPGDVSNFLTETAVEITHVVLNGETYDVSLFSNGDPIGTDGHLIYLVDVGGDIEGVYITGLLEGDVVGVQTSDPFSRLAITNGSDDSRPGGGTFADGDFANTFDISDLAFLLEGQAGEPIELSFDVVGTDFDGDTIPGEIDVTVTPDDANNIVGDENVNDLDGTDGADLIAGLAGNDDIDAGLGADIIIGGLGADALNGGAGADIFVYDMAEFIEAAVDIVESWEDGVDTFDLTGLNFIVDPDGGDANTDNLNDFVRVLDAGGASDTLQVDIDGSGSADWVTIAQFDTEVTTVAILYNDDDEASGTNLANANIVA